MGAAPGRPGQEVRQGHEDDEAQRRGRRTDGEGELDGVRVTAPETVYAATRPCRRLRPDVAVGLMPLRWGTGYATGRYGGWAGAYAFWTANHWW